MKEYGVLTAIGQDRIGFVDDLTREIEECGGNIEESKMVALGGEFAAVMLFSGEKGVLSALISRKESKTLAAGGLVEIRETTAGVSREGRPYLIEAVSLDSLGIVHRISHILKSLGVSIEDLESETIRAPWTGSPLFKMRLRITIPKDVHLSALKEKLNEAAEELDLDLSLSALVPPMD